MTRASGVSATVELRAIPFIAGAQELAEQGVAPGGTHRNLESLEPDVTWDDSVTEIQKLLLADAQTSGGLLISVPESSTRSSLRRPGAARRPDSCGNRVNIRVPRARTAVRRFTLLPDEPFTNSESS